MKTETLPKVDGQGVGAGMAVGHIDNPKNPLQWKADKKIRPNEKCPCGSGKKHKKCCMYSSI